MKRVCLFVSYFGQHYNGSQIQPPPCRSVQRSLQVALSLFLRRPKDETLRTRISSRTDAGVNALHNMLIFEENISFKQLNILKSELNSHFLKNGESLRISEVKLVKDEVEFCPMKSVIEKLYKYKLIIPDDYYADIQTHIFNSGVLIRASQFDERLFRDAAEILNGVHDYSNFTATDTNHPENMLARVVRSTDITVEADKDSDAFPMNYMLGDDASRSYQRYIINFKSKGFMYKQIRYMVGSMISVAIGRLTLDSLRSFLDRPEHYRDEKCKLFVASPYGLYLARLRYPEECFRDWKPSSNLRR